MALFLLSALGPLGLAAGANAQEIALVRGQSLYLSDQQFSSFTPMASGGVYAAAYDKGGMLWFTRRLPGQYERCALYQAAAPTSVVWSFAQLAGAIDAQQGLCDIRTDPAGGLLFVADNGTAGSLRTWHLDTASGQVSAVAPGYAPTISPDGATLVLVVHTYNPFPRGGSYEALWSGSAQALPAHLRRLTPANANFGSPTFSPDGRQLAVVRNVFSRSSVQVGPIRGPRHSVFPGAPGRQLGWIGWLSDGRRLLVLGSRDSATTLYSVDLTGGHPHAVLTDVNSLALRPG